MEVKINREIRNYTESMFFGLSLRQFVFSLLAVGVAVLLYFVLKPYVGTETVSWMCIMSPVTQTAEVEVNNASEKGVASPLRLENGNIKRKVPKMITQKKPMMII